MMTHPGMKVYQSIAGQSLNGREADATCFRMLIDELKAAEASTDLTVRQKALSQNQRLWSMIMNANTLDTGTTPREDRELYVNLANRSQIYGIKAILDQRLPLAPLIQIAENVRDGLEAASARQFSAGAA
jgi:flagellar biosynthesis regulator FlaF